MNKLHKLISRIPIKIEPSIPSHPSSHHYNPYATLHSRPRNRTLLHRRILSHTRMLRNLTLMMLQLSIRHRTNTARVLLVQRRMRRRQVRIDRPDDGARGVREGVLGVGVLERRARGGVHGFLVVGGDVGVGGVVVDDVVVVVGDFGVGYGAAGFGVCDGVLVEV